jgi:hypothetical protein
VDVVVCLSHSGLEEGQDGTITDGDDARLAKAVPGIDVVVGGYSHTALHQPIIINNRTPVVQVKKYSMNAPKRSGRSRQVDRLHTVVSMTMDWQTMFAWSLVRRTSVDHHAAAE